MVTELLDFRSAARVCSDLGLVLMPFSAVMRTWSELGALNATYAWALFTAVDTAVAARPKFQEDWDMWGWEAQRACRAQNYKQPAAQVTGYFQTSHRPCSWRMAFACTNASAVMAMGYTADQLSDTWLERLDALQPSLYGLGRVGSGIRLVQSDLVIGSSTPPPDAVWFDGTDQFWEQGPVVSLLWRVRGIDGDGTILELQSLLPIREAAYDQVYPLLNNTKLLATAPELIGSDSASEGIWDGTVVGPWLDYIVRVEGCWNEYTVERLVLYTRAGLMQSVGLSDCSNTFAEDAPPGGYLAAFQGFHSKVLAGNDSAIGRLFHIHQLRLVWAAAVDADQQQQSTARFVVPPISIGNGTCSAARPELQPMRNTYDRCGAAVGLVCPTNLCCGGTITGGPSFRSILKCGQTDDTCLKDTCQQAYGQCSSPEQGSLMFGYQSSGILIDPSDPVGLTTVYSANVLNPMEYKTGSGYCSSLDQLGLSWEMVALDDLLRWRTSINTRHMAWQGLFNKEMWVAVNPLAVAANQGVACQRVELRQENGEVMHVVIPGRCNTTAVVVCKAAAGQNTTSVGMPSSGSPAAKFAPGPVLLSVSRTVGAGPSGDSCGFSTLGGTGSVPQMQLNLSYPAWATKSSSSLPPPPSPVEPGPSSQTTTTSQTKVSALLVQPITRVSMSVSTTHGWTSGNTERLSGLRVGTLGNPQNSAVFGTPSTGGWRTLQLQDGEVIVAVSGCSGGYVERLVFHTSLGRRWTAPITRQSLCSSPFVEAAPPGGYLVGLQGIAGQVVEQVQFVWADPQAQPAGSANGGSSSPAMAAGIGVGVGGGMLLLALFGAWWWRRRRQRAAGYGIRSPEATPCCKLPFLNGKAVNHSKSQLEGKIFGEGSGPGCTNGKDSGSGGGGSDCCSHGNSISGDRNGDSREAGSTGPEGLVAAEAVIPGTASWISNGAFNAPGIRTDGPAVAAAIDGNGAGSSDPRDGLRALRSVVSAKAGDSTAAAAAAVSATAPSSTALSAVEVRGVNGCGNNTSRVAAAAAAAQLEGVGHGGGGGGGGGSQEFQGSHMASGDMGPPAAVPVGTGGPGSAHTAQPAQPAPSAADKVAAGALVRPEWGRGFWGRQQALKQGVGGSSLGPEDGTNSATLVTTYLEAPLPDTPRDSPTVRDALSKERPGHPLHTDDAVGHDAGNAVQGGKNDRVPGSGSKPAAMPFPSSQSAVMQSAAPCRSAEGEGRLLLRPWQSQVARREVPWRDGTGGGGHNGAAPSGDRPHPRPGPSSADGPQPWTCTGQGYEVCGTDTTSSSVWPAVMTSAGYTDEMHLADVVWLPRGEGGQSPSGAGDADRADPALNLELGRDVDVDPGSYLGHGASGVVRRGVLHTAMGDMEVAVKMLSSADATEAAAGMHAGHLKGLEQEIRVLSRLAHPNIVRFFGARLEPSSPFIVEELMAISLNKLVHAKSRATGDFQHKYGLAHIIQISRDMAAGLSYLHPTVVHRDLKPGNVLLDERGIAKIGDFGLARFKANTALTSRDIEVGTAPYMAPEVFMANTDNKVTDRSDIYSLGIIINEMITRQRPWEGLRPVVIGFQVAVERKRPPLPAPDNPLCPRGLRSIIERCWRHNPEERPSSAEIVKRLTLLLAEQTGGPPNANSLPNASSRLFARTLTAAGLHPQGSTPQTHPSSSDGPGASNTPGSTGNGDGGSGGGGGTSSTQRPATGSGAPQLDPNQSPRPQSQSLSQSQPPSGDSSAPVTGGGDGSVGSGATGGSGTAAGAGGRRGVMVGSGGIPAMRSGRMLLRGSPKPSYIGRARSGSSGPDWQPVLWPRASVASKEGAETEAKGPQGAPTPREAPPGGGATLAGVAEAETTPNVLPGAKPLTTLPESATLTPDAASAEATSADASVGGSGALEDAADGTEDSAPASMGPGSSVHVLRITYALPPVDSAYKLVGRKTATTAKDPDPESRDLGSGA